MANTNSTPVRSYEITGRGDGHRYGIYQGETPEAAVRALLEDAGSDDDPDMGAWYVCPVELPAALVDALSTLCERDEAGRHFTETCGCLDELEALGLIEIDRPIHEATGIPYSQEYWHLTVTDAGIEAVEAAGY